MIPGSKSIIRTFAVAREAAKPRFKPVAHGWKPSEKDAGILRSIASEFRSNLVSPDRPESLAGTLGYGITPMDIIKALETEVVPEELSQLVSLHYANAKQIYQYNVRKTIELFGRRPNDTGSPEVQAAILTVRIGSLLKHKEIHKHDYSAVRLVIELVHERKRHLKYLRRLSLTRYFELLDRLGLPHDYLESFENPYLYRYRPKSK